MPSLASLLFKPIAGSLSAAKGALTGTARFGGRNMAFGAASRMAFGGAVGAGVGATQGYDINSRLEGAAKGALAGAGIAAGVVGMQRHGLPAAGKAGQWLTNSKGFARRGALKSSIKNPIGPKMESGQFFTNMPSAWGKELSLKEQFKNTGVAKLGRGGVAVGLPMARAGVRAIDFIGNNPALVMGAAGAVAGGTALAASARSGQVQDLSSPTMEGASVNTNYDEQAIAAQQMGQIGGGRIGTAPQMQEQFQYANWMSQVGSMAANTRGGRMAQSASGLVQGLHASRHS